MNRLISTAAFVFLALSGAAQAANPANSATGLSPCDNCVLFFNETGKWHAVTHPVAKGLLDIDDLESSVSTLNTNYAGTNSTLASHTASIEALADDVEALQTDKMDASAVSPYIMTMADDADAATARATLGLGNVDNTSDANKPVSTATQTALDGKAASSHTHVAGDVTSGTFADGRIAQSNVTQHQAALSVTSTQVTGTKTSAYISDFTTAARTAVGAPTIYLGTTAKTNVKLIAKSATIAGGAGQAIFYLTDNGLSGGTALCANAVYDETVDFEVNDSSAFYRPAWTIAGDRKSITATVTRATATGVIAVLGLNLLSAPTNAPNGTVVRLTVWCD